MRHFLDAVLRRCSANPRLDDQTNLFDEFSREWLSKGKALLCTGPSESDSQPLGRFSWPEPPAASAAVLAFAASSGHPSGSNIIRACPLPRLPFATGFAHKVPTAWRTALEATASYPVALHFNCLGRGGGHDKKRSTVEEIGLWIWDTAPREEWEDGTCSALPEQWAQ